MADQSNGADLLRHHRTVRGASVAALRIRTAEPGLGTTVARFYVAIARGEASGHEVSNSSLTSGLIRVLEVATRRRHLDEIPPDMGPAERQDQPARSQAGQLLVGAIAIAYQDRTLAQPAEQRRGGGRAARCIDMQIHRIHAGRDPQPGAAGRARRGELPDPIAVGKRVAPLPPQLR